MLLVRISLALVVALASLAGSAQAATLSLNGTTAVYDADRGETNDVVATDDASSGVTMSDAGAPITAGPGCAAQGDGSVRCAPADRWVVRLRDGADRFSGNACASVTAGEVDGGPGDDEVFVGTCNSGTALDATGGPGDDTLRSSVNFGGAATLSGGPGADTLDVFEDGPDVRLFGGPGPDTLRWAAFSGVIQGGAGDDTYVPSPRQGFDPLAALANVARGPGLDTFDLSALGGVTFDLATCDGCAERVIGTPFDDIILGTRGAELIEAGDGDDTIDPRGGTDVVAGQDGDDTINLTDGRLDVTLCGGGSDTVTADDRDILGGDCELVDRVVS